MSENATDRYWTQTEATIQGNKPIRMAAHAIREAIDRIEAGNADMTSWDENDLPLLKSALRDLGGNSP